MSATAYIALGSNLGDRRAYLEQALKALHTPPGQLVQKVSSFIETDPVGGPEGQGKYLNAVAEIETQLPPRDLLEALLEIEQFLGRRRRERDGPRTLDLDVLLYGDTIRDKPDLIIPHPRMHERRFVLEPLAQIAPDVKHPKLGKTIRELLAELSQPTQGRELSGLRAFVTGSTSGIGQAIAQELAGAGAEVITHGRRLRKSGNAASRKRIPADLRDSAACTRLVAKAWQSLNGIDIWINNAGADTLTGEAADWSFERKLEELLAVDLRATMLLSREVGKRMKEAGHGVIINMGWDQADTGMEGDSGQMFGAVKGAVMAFTKSLALTLAPEVRVNCLAPGWIKTAWGESASEKWQERVLQETPLQRWGTPRDVAAAARWLVSPAAAYVTGQIIRVNGGAVR